MRYSLFCFSDNGSMLAQKICGLLGIDIRCVNSVEKFASRYGFTPHVRISDDMQQLFSESDVLVFIGAAGIAVREIAPYVAAKQTDPAVIVIDDRGRYVISLLSGHIGGANAVAKGIAELIEAQAVITTATDGAGRFSCDAWAVSHNCEISSLKIAKDISSAILTKDIPVSSEYEIPDVLPAGLIRGDSGELGIYIGKHKTDPYASTLRLIPRTLTLGIGCRKGISVDAVREAVRKIMDESGIDIRAVGTVASIDIKKDEAGLLAFAKEIGAETEFYTADELNAVPGEFSESEFVKKTVGTGNVCERAAALSGGEIIIKKTAHEGVTVAVSEKDWRIEF